ncbi:hypothetical protein [Nocardia sp. NPDC051832]|uniref:hypothetical protein n=1 Tax=Nocardia sp. NPDC051832 TaxID=3155673 RepID=UPI003433A9AC
MIRTAIAAALIATATIVPTAHAEPGYHAAALNVCGFAFNRNPYLLHTAVVVGGIVRCEPKPPLKFRIDVQLWYKARGASPQPEGMPVSDKTIPNPNLQVATMALDCRTGLWQGRIKMEATWDTGIDKASKETEWTFIGC